MDMTLNIKYGIFNKLNNHIIYVLSYGIEAI